MDKKILLVDDSRTQLNTLKLFFQKAGFKVVTAPDALSAYPLVFHEAPDLVISDIMMPNLDGYQFCRLIKNNHLIKKIPVILLTVLEQRIDRFWGKEAGAQLFISKNSSFEDIVTAAEDLTELYPLTAEDKALMMAQKVNGDSIQYQLNSILDDSLQQSVIMNDFRFLTEFLEDEKVLVENMFSLLASLVDYNACSLFFNNIDDKDRLTVYYDIQKRNVSDKLLKEMSKRIICDLTYSTVCEEDNFANIVFMNHQDETPIEAYDEFKTVYILPVRFEERLLGAVAFYNINEVNYNLLKFMEIMQSELLLLMRIKRLYAETKYLAVTDTLTGLYNRRHLGEYLHREYSRTRRYKGSFSVAIVDLDKFKSVNDTYGHQVGDYVLKESAQLLVSVFRKTDMIFRYGGEEFIVLLPETSSSQAFIPLERFRKKLEAFNFTFDEVFLRMTVSGGIADNSTNVEDEEALIKNADDALYKAKETGRNRIVISNE